MGNQSHVAGIVVDLQNDFCRAEGALAAEGEPFQRASSVIEPVNQMTAGIRSAGGLVAYLRSVYTDVEGHYWLPGMAIQAEERWKDRGRGETVPFLREGHWGTEFDERLDIATSDLVITKRSADGFYGNALAPELVAHGIRTVMVMGVTTDCCILFTAQEAYQRGFEVIIVEECVDAYDEQRHRSALDVLGWVFGRVIPLRDALDRLKQV